MNNGTTFQGNGEVAYIPVVVNGKQKSQTNVCRLRTMSDIELASFFFWDVDGSGKTQWQWLDWLKQEAE